MEYAADGWTEEKATGECGWTDGVHCPCIKWQLDETHKSQVGQSRFCSAARVQAGGNGTGSGGRDTQLQHAAGDVPAGPSWSKHLQATLPGLACFGVPLFQVSLLECGGSL